MSRPTNHDDNLLASDPGHRLRRRAFLRLATATAAAPFAGGLVAGVAGDADAHVPTPTPYSLPGLPIKPAALKGFVSPGLIEEHHAVHHASHVEKLNQAVRDLQAARHAGDFQSLRSLCQTIALHASAHRLHTSYWQSLSPHGGGDPVGNTLTLVEANFESVDAWRAEFAAAARSLPGNGWVILAFEPVGQRLFVLPVEGHQETVILGAHPLLACDLWDHAYAPQFANRRDDYVAAFFDVLNWDSVALRLKEIHG